MSVKWQSALFILTIFLLSAFVSSRKLFMAPVPAPNQLPITEQVVVATSDIPRGTVLTANQLSTRACPKDLVPQGSITNMKVAEGRKTLYALTKHDLVNESALAEWPSGNGSAPVVPGNMKAMSILTPILPGSAASAIKAGSKVDVWSTAQDHTTMIADNIDVLAVNPSSATALCTVTLLVSADQAARLHLAQDNGMIQLQPRTPEAVTTVPSPVAVPEPSKKTATTPSASVPAKVAVEPAKKPAVVATPAVPEAVVPETKKSTAIVPKATPPAVAGSELPKKPALVPTPLPAAGAPRPPGKTSVIVTIINGSKSQDHVIQFDPEAWATPRKPPPEKEKAAPEKDATDNKNAPEKGSPSKKAVPEKDPRIKPKQ